MTGKRFTIRKSFVRGLWSVDDKEKKFSFSPSENKLKLMSFVKRLNELNDEKQKLERINKGQEKEIVRLHKLADAMSGVLMELGIYDVYNEEQIQSIKEKLE